MTKLILDFYSFAKAHKNGVIFEYAYEQTALAFICISHVSCERNICAIFKLTFALYDMW